MARVATLACLLAIVVTAAVVIDGDEAPSHRLTAVFDSAVNVRQGFAVKVGGRPVGEIAAVRVDGRSARLDLTITDDRAWPLAKGTRARLRWAGTTAFASRYVELVPGRAAGSDLADGARIEMEDTVAPVEFDEILRTFDARTRRRTREFLDRSGQALRAASGGVRGVVRRTPAALDATRGALDDLGGDPKALDTLIRSTDRVVAAVNAAQPGVDPLVRDLAAALDASAAAATDIQRTLDKAPTTLVAARGTLGRADGTLDRAKDLTAALRPGVSELRTLARPLNDVVRRVDATAPLATGTLRTLRSASPSLTKVLARAETAAPKLESIAKQATEQVRCIRPYGPEIAGFPASWAGFLQNGDRADKYARIHLQAMPYFYDTPLTSQQASSLSNQTVAFPRPPGLSVGKPWFIPSCGVGPETVEAAQDPERRR